MSNKRNFIQSFILLTWIQIFSSEFTYANSMLNGHEKEFLNETSIQGSVHPSMEASPDTCSIYTYLHMSVCLGEYVQFGEQELSNSGLYIDTLTAQNGCDSVIYLFLEIYPQIHATIEETICHGGIYIFDGIPLSQAGSYTKTLISGNGCDSIVQLILTVVPTLVSYIDTTICEGKSIYLLGQYISESGTISAEFTGSNGCDSIITYVVFVQELEVPVTISENSIIVLPSASSYQWINCDNGEEIVGANSQSYAPIESGNYSVKVILEDSCVGTSECIAFIVTGIEDDHISGDVSIYPNPSEGIFYIKNESQYPISSMIINTLSGNQVQVLDLSGKKALDLSFLEKGVYLIKFELNNTALTKKIIIK